MIIEDFIKEISVINLEPNDVLVVKHESNITDMEREKMYHVLRGVFHNNEIVVCSKDIDYEVIKEGK